MTVFNEKHVLYVWRRPSGQQTPVFALMHIIFFFFCERRKYQFILELSFKKPNKPIDTEAVFSKTEINNE